MLLLSTPISIDRRNQECLSWLDRPKRNKNLIYSSSATSMKANTMFLLKQKKSQPGYATMDKIAPPLK
jgi:hypothetical protein